MPVSEILRLEALTEQLRHAAQQQDWERLAQLDALLAQWVHQVPQGAALDAEVRAAWQRLAQMHAHARDVCRGARDEAAARLRDLQCHNEANKAYAWQEQFS